MRISFYAGDTSICAPWRLRRRLFAAFPRVGEVVYLPGEDEPRVVQLVMHDYHGKCIYIRLFGDKSITPQEPPLWLRVLLKYLKKIQSWANKLQQSNS